MTQNPPTTTTFVLDLVGRGIQSHLASKIAEHFPDLRTLVAAEPAALRKHLTGPELDALARALKRKEIPAPTIFKLVQECDWKCCLCWNIDKEGPVVIHHIEEHSKTLDDSYANLVLLCPNHHAKAHSKWEISRSPWPPEFIRFRKAQWVQAVAEFKAGLRKGPGREEHWLADLRPSPPPPSGRFVGRAEDLQEIGQRILDPQSRRIALAGMGGVGKTTLALKLAEEHALNFPGGVFWADLSDENGDILAVLQFWLESCAGPGNYPNDRNGASSALRALLLKHVTTKGSTLFVIDDAREAWIDTVRHLLDIIPSNASVVLTTRDTTVPSSLGLPARPVIPLTPEIALELLRRTAESPLVNSNEGVAASLAELLGGLPLALILVAKHIAVNASKPGYSLEALRQKIERFSTDVLAFPGHRGLAASFALSYDTLDTEDKRVFRWLGAFAAGPLRTGGISKITRIQADQAERSLDRMVATSILNWGAEPGVYRIHPLLHQYAAHLLGKRSRSAEFLEASKSHMHYFADLVDSISSSRPRSHDELQAELPNILLAIDTANENAEWPLVSNFMRGLWSETDFLSFRGYERLAVGLLEKAASACRQSHDIEMEAAHLGNLAAAKNRLGLLSEAKKCLEQASSLARQSGRTRDVPAFLQNLGVLLMDLGETTQALKVLREALENAERERNLPVAMDVIGTLGSYYLRCGDFPHAAHYYSAGLELCRMAGDRLGEGNNLSNLGLVLLETGAVDEGERCIKQALEIARSIGDKHGQANRLGHLGGIWLKRSMKTKSMVDHIFALGQARRFTEQALCITREVGDRIHEECWLGNLANCYSVGGDSEKAAQCLLRAIEIARETGHKESEGQWLFNLGVLERDSGNPGTARTRISEAVAIFQSINSRHLAAAKAALESLGHPRKRDA